jgi:hypothetical protein
MTLTIAPMQAVIWVIAMGAVMLTLVAVIQMLLLIVHLLTA